MYIIFKTIIDTGDLDKLKAMTIATTGGIILFYGIGSMFGFVLNGIINGAKHSKSIFVSLSIFYGIYLVMHNYYLLDTFINLMSRLTGRYFLISDIRGGYQRPANFLIISSLILSFLYINILLISDNYRLCFEKVIIALYFFIYIIDLILSMLLSQMIQSNNGLVFIGDILLVNLFLHVYLFFPRNRRILEKYFFEFKNIVFGKIGKKIILSGLITFFCFVIVLVFSIGLIGIDMSMLRISGYGEGKISSIETRRDTNSAFPIHFFYSPGTPIWGNMQIDTLTTGTGSYMHSFLLSILTHSGVLGFSIIVIFLYLSCKELLKKDALGIYENGIKIYKMMLFCSSFIIANMAYFFTNISFWFLMGFVFSPINTRKVGNCQ
jgi:hypothetical protein